MEAVIFGDRASWSYFFNALHEARFNRAFHILQSKWGNAWEAYRQTTSRTFVQRRALGFLVLCKACLSLRTQMPEAAKEEATHLLGIFGLNRAQVQDNLTTATLTAVNFNPQQMPFLYFWAAILIVAEAESNPTLYLALRHYLRNFMRLHPEDNSHLGWTPINLNAAAEFSLLRASELLVLCDAPECAYELLENEVSTPAVELQKLRLSLCAGRHERAAAILGKLNSNSLCLEAGKCALYASLNRSDAASAYENFSSHVWAQGSTRIDASLRSLTGASNSAEMGSKGRNASAPLGRSASGRASGMVRASSGAIGGPDAYDGVGTELKKEIEGFYGRDCYHVTSVLSNNAAVCYLHQGALYESFAGLYSTIERLLPLKATRPPPGQRPVIPREDPRPVPPGGDQRAGDSRQDQSSSDNRSSPRPSPPEKTGKPSPPSPRGKPSPSVTRTSPSSREPKTFDGSHLAFRNASVLNEFTLEPQKINALIEECLTRLEVKDPLLLIKSR